MAKYSSMPRLLPLQTMLVLMLFAASLCGRCAADKKDDKAKNKDLRAVNFCMPIKLFVVPGEADTPALALEGDDGETIDTYTPKIDNDGLLSLEMDGRFATSRATRLKLSVPRDGNLSKIENVCTGSVVMAQGFVMDKLNLVNSGTGYLFATNLTVGSLSVDQQGAGRTALFVRGDIESVKAVLSGVGDVFVLGVTDKANAIANGIGTVYVGTDEGVAVEVEANGITGKVAVMGGECDVKGDGVGGDDEEEGDVGFGDVNLGFGPVCVKFTEDDVPALHVEEECGNTSDGEPVCDASAGKPKGNKKPGSKADDEDNP